MRRKGQLAKTIENSLYKSEEIMKWPINTFSSLIQRYNDNKIECYRPSIDMEAAAKRLLELFRTNLVYLKDNLRKCKMYVPVKVGFC